MPENEMPQNQSQQMPNDNESSQTVQHYGLKAHDYVQVQCCSGKKCHKNDSERIINLFKVMLHAHGVDDMVDVVTSGCFGFCAKGPIVRILPDNITYTHVRPEDVNVIVEKHVVRGELVDELRYVEVAAHHIEVESQHWSSFKRPVSLDSMLNNYIYEIGGKPFLNVLSYAIDPEKCRGCTACKRNCPVNAISGVVKQPHTINPYKCTCCGKCKTKCKFDAIDGPIGVLDERNSVNDVLADIENTDKLVVAQTAPAVRFALGEEFGLAPGSVVTGKMITALRELGFDYVVTGHYAQIERDEATGRYLLKKAVDPSKDQSYVLYSLTQSQLKKTLFPLGSLTKDKTRETAERLGLINAHKRDSQDICFVPDGDYAAFIEKYTGKAYPNGDFVDESGRILGEHKGIIRYTIGQRKGLGLALPCPMYVKEKNLAENKVVLCENDALFSRELYADDINLISVERLEKPIRVKARVRYNQKEQPATAEQLDDNTLHVVFDEPQRAICKGQAVVLYDGDYVVGGGTIIDKPKQK